MAEPRRTRPWVKIVLAVSLALNLAVVGLVAGAILSGPRDGFRDRHRDAPPVLGDLGFGPFVVALPEADRREMSQGLVREAGAFRENRAEMRRQFKALLEALRAEPYDGEAVRVLIEDQRARVSDRAALGQRLLLERIDAMSAAERAAYADALDKALRRRGPPRDKR